MPGYFLSRGDGQGGDVKRQDQINVQLFWCSLDRTAILAVLTMSMASLGSAKNLPAR